MRATLIAMAAVAGITVVGVGSISAAPINGGVIDKAVNTGALTDQVHCRWYPTGTAITFRTVGAVVARADLYQSPRRRRRRNSSLRS